MVQLEYRSFGIRYLPASVTHCHAYNTYYKLSKIFYILYFFRVGLSLVEIEEASKIERCGDEFCPPMLFMCLVPVSHLFLVINSSVNIVIYCLIGDGFRYGVLFFLKICNIFMKFSLYYILLKYTIQKQFTKNL